MSLYAQKLLAVLVTPLGASLALMIAGLALSAGGRRRLGVLGLAGGLGLLWAASTPIAAHVLIGSLEDDFPAGDVDRGPVAEAIVVLGGSISPPRPPSFQLGLTDASDRVLHAARLYRAGRAPRVVITGGSILWLSAGGAEAYPVAALLEEWGVPRDALLLETESRTTRENAVFTRRLLDAHGIRRVLLVTSAAHMSRALATFRKAGVDAVPAPTDFHADPDRPGSALDWLPDARALAGTSAALKERIGTLVYRLRGWL